ncbi:DUF928 domain-containing protein, partial [Fischerella thermalis]
VGFDSDWGMGSIGGPPGYLERLAPSIMNGKKRHDQQITLFLILTGILASGTGVLARQAEPERLLTTAVSESSFQLALKLKLPPRGAPGKRRTGAATRDSCPELANKNEPLTALVPGTNLGLTVAERPTFWFYVPYPPTNRLSVEFLLRDKEDNEVYRETLPLLETPGIISVRFPETTPPLEIQKLYSWRFSVICNPTNRAEDVFVNGKVERVPLAPALKSQLAAATPRERIALYAENGLWFDTLTHLTELYRTHPKDEALKVDWADLWQGVGLEYISSKPLVPCCTP